MKKTLSFLLVLCLMFSLSVSAFAATATPTVSAEEIKPGEDVTVTLTLGETIEKISVVDYKLYFDPDLFQFKEFTSLVTDFTLKISKTAKTDDKGSYYSISFLDIESEGEGFTFAAGDFAKVTFTAKENVTDAKDAKFELAIETIGVWNESGVSVDASNEHAVADAITVTVKPASQEVTEDGSAEHPYLIKTAQDLVDLANEVRDGLSSSGIENPHRFENVEGANAFAGKYFRLENDIDMSGVADTFAPIGSFSSWSPKPFSGTFDGNYHKITGLTINTTYSNRGLFGHVKNGTVKNLIVSGNVTAGTPSAGIVAVAEASVLSNLGNEVNVVGAESSSGVTFGGVAAEIRSGTKVEGCYNAGSVSASNKNSSTRIGGIVGNATGAYGGENEIINCYNVGNITITGPNYSYANAGGIVGGVNTTSAKLTITNCYNGGTVSGQGTGYSGDTDGILADNKGSGQTLTNTYVSQPDDASELGDAFENGTTGYPTLKWQSLGGGTPEHTHDLKLVAEVPASCTETGMKAYYECSDAECGKLFEDAEGKVEITDKDTLVTEALGHDYNEKLECQREGCDYVNPVLALIQEKAGAENFTAASSTTQLWQATGTDGKTLEANGADTAVFTLKALKDGTLTVKARILGMMQSKLTITSGETVKASLYSTDTSSAQTVTSDAIEVKAGDVLTFTYSNDYTWAKPADYYVQITGLNFKESEEDTTVVLTINEKTADAAEATEKATFTKTALVEKAVTSPTIGYQYWRSGAQNLLVTTKYVTLDTLLAGIDFEPGDKLIVKASDGFSVTYTYETLSTAKYYQAEENGTLEEVPAALAIFWDSGAKTFEELEASAEDKESLRFGHGIASGEYGKAAGKRLVSKVSEITVVHPCAEHKLADKVLTAATCTETGVSTKYCTVCGYVSTETFTTPALGHDISYTVNANGTHTATCTRGDFTETAAHTYGDDGLCVCGAKKPDFAGYTVAVTAAPAEIAAGEESTVSLKVGHTDETVTAFNAYRFVLTYDADKLTYKSTSLTDAKVTAADGTLTILGYGDDKATAQALTVTFEGKAAGTATVALTAANIDAQSNAHVQDAPEALIEPSSTEITVTAVYNVDLPGDFTGESTVKHGEDYTFEAKDKNYDYTFGGSTMGGEDVTVVDNGDGTFTVKNVTGDLVIKSSKTGKPYDVTVSGTGAADVTAADKANYGTDYTFSIAKEAGYTYTVTVTIGGTSHYVTENNGSYTISGSSITGNIEINVAKTTQVITTTTINFVGTGAADVKGGESQTATIGQDFTFEINAETGFTYTVKLGETVIDPVDGKYTISGGLIGTDTVTVTVEKNAEYTVEVVEYVKAANAQSVFLVTVKGTPATGSVFAYGGEAMSHSEKYDAYAYLVFSGKTLAEVKTEAAAKITEITGTAAEIDYTGDVNVSNLIDVNDAQLVWNMYNAKYADFTTATMEMFLRADMNGDKTLNVNDATAVVNAIK